MQDKGGGTKNKNDEKFRFTQATQSGERQDGAGNRLGKTEKETAVVSQRGIAVETQKEHGSGQSSGGDHEKIE